MIRADRRWRGAAAALALAAVASSADAQTQTGQQRNRDQWQRSADVIAALAIDSGGRVADIGAGQGFYTERLAKRVGSQGRVFAVEIDVQVLDKLEQLVASQGLTNVELVLGKADDPRLPYRSLDAVLIVNAYHEMTRHTDMLREIHASLKPGGRLVILDNPPHDKTAPRIRQVDGHQIDIEIVIGELRDAGFEIVTRDDAFARHNNNGNIHENWLLVARRGEQAAPLRRL